MAVGKLRPLGGIAHVFVGAATRASASSDGRDRARFLTVKCLQSGGLDSTEITAYDTRPSWIDRYSVKPGDVLLPARSTFWQVAIVPEELGGLLINATLIAVRCLPRLHPCLLKSFLEHQVGQSRVVALTQSGTSQMNVTVRALSDLEVPVPEWGEQADLVELVTAATEAHKLAISAARKRFDIVRETTVRAMLPASRRV